LPDYVIWLVDKSDNISATHELAASDDAAAIEAAKALGPAPMIQVWRDGKYVKGIRNGARS
jgi:hypothetical protein